MRAARGCGCSRACLVIVLGRVIVGLKTLLRRARRRT